MIQNTLQKQVLLQDTLLEISAMLIDATQQTIDQTITNSLKILGELLHCDRTYVFTYDTTKATTSNTHEWCAEGITEEIDNLQGIPIETLSGWHDLHAKGNELFIKDVSTLENKAIKTILESQKIKTVLTVPMMKSGECKGFVGFDSVRSHREYDVYEPNLLKEFANILWSAMERIRLQKKLEDSEIMLRTVLDTIPVRVFWKDTKLKYLGANKLFAQDAGYDDPKAIIGKIDTQLHWTNQAALYNKDDLSVLKNNKPKINYEEPQTSSDGKAIWLKTSKVPLKNSSGELIGILGTYEDVTKIKKLSLNIQKAHKKIETENQRFMNLVNSTDDIIFELDTDLKHRAVYGKWLNKYNYKASVFLNKTFTEILGKKDALIHIKHAKIALKGESTTYEWHSNINNEKKYFQTSLSPIIDKEKVIGIVGIGRDVTEKVKHLDEIEYLSFHDYLTGLYNRRFFEEELKRLNTKRNYPFGIMIMDVNGLKLLNDAFGHNAGDEALKAVANSVKKVCREDDIIARIGGDEFGIILPNTPSDACDNIRLRIGETISAIKINNLEVSVAIGYSIKNTDREDLTTLIKNAEDYMYKRKAIESKSIRNKSIQSILKTLTDKHIEEQVHSERVGKICKRLGVAMQLSQDMIDELYHAGTLHDIGKITMPDSILKKPSALTSQEREIIEKHTVNGYQILRSADEYSNLAEYALSHHEWFDGNGYPNKLKGTEIPLISRIIAIADAYEVMTSDRPYRKAPGQAYAIKELKNLSGKQFDPHIVDVFIDTLQSKE